MMQVRCLYFSLSLHLRLVSFLFERVSLCLLFYRLTYSRRTSTLRETPKALTILEFDERLQLWASGFQVA